MADPRIFDELRRSSIRGKRRWLAYGYPVDINIYISTVELLKLDAAPPVLESVSYYRYAAPSGHALLLCRLRHSLYGPFALVLERWGDGCDMEATSASSRVPESFTGCLSDKVTAIATPTEREDSEFIKEPPCAVPHNAVPRLLTYPLRSRAYPVLSSLKRSMLGWKFYSTAVHRK
ncbi:hypothetical protein B0H14DRAFT_3690436 [Mycena olivaceomarginata]|nr:hypothetical protein B0H14DRAFT_3690436 [Mycena olivaceomarginata]